MTERSAATASNEDDQAAVIDIGSNTIHLLVANCPAGRIQPIHDRSVRSGLGIAVADGAPLGSDRIQAVASVVRVLAAEAREHRAREVTVLGTHAVRAAPDRDALLRVIERDAGVVVHVLSPEQEAVLCVAGAALGPLPSPPFLCVDIGGGSCDLAAVDASGVSSVVSLPVGSGVLAARDLGGDPPQAAQAVRAAGALRDLCDAAGFPGYPEFVETVATGGAARRLRRQVQAEPDAVALPTSLLLDTIRLLLREPSAEWPHAVRPDRAPLVRAGGIIAEAIVVRWRVARWRVSAYGLREGALARRARGLSLDAAVPSGALPVHLRDMEGSRGHRGA
jgi:exopolyphosphatase/pppGpp-phosphohydrolase